MYLTLELKPNDVQRLFLLKQFYLAEKLYNHLLEYGLRYRHESSIYIRNKIFDYAKKYNKIECDGDLLYYSVHKICVNVANSIVQGDITEIDSTYFSDHPLVYRSGKTINKVQCKAKLSRKAGIIDTSKTPDDYTSKKYSYLKLYLIKGEFMLVLKEHEPKRGRKPKRVSIQVEIEPTSEQKEIINNQFETSVKIYKAALKFLRDNFSELDKKPTRTKMIILCNKFLRKEHSTLGFPCNDKLIRYPICEAVIAYINNDKEINNLNMHRKFSYQFGKKAFKKQSKVLIPLIKGEILINQKDQEKYDDFLHKFKPDIFSLTKNSNSKYSLTLYA